MIFSSNAGANDFELAQRTHWQQARLLLPEPLAVNRGQHVHATITFTAHESRSYYIDIDIYIKSEGSDQIDERTRRQARWNLAQQTLNYSYQGDEATAAQSWKAATSAYS
jgi:histone-arginine methyltransferase CARM1